MLDSNALRQIIINNGLARVADKLIESVKPCTTIHTITATDDYIPIGESKFGGSPDVPVEFDWPTWKNLPLSFLGQINLSTIAKNPIAALLPTEGLLSFFYNAE